MKKTALGLLRQISIHVEEPRPGAFEWVLQEADAAEPDAWKPLKRARKPSRTYHAAMANGLAALESLIDNLDTGPRSAAGLDMDANTERETAHKRPARSVKSARREQKAVKGTAFGFGLPQ